MAQNRDNCIILLVDPPEADKISQELKTAFGPERASHVNSDLLTASYKLAKGFGDAMLMISYQKTQRHPDLTWLDPEDPGFLEVKNHALEDRMQDAFRLAFFTGAKKVVLINHLSPELKVDWLSLAFEAVSDKTVAIGANQDGSFYLLGLTQQNLKIFETPGFTHGKKLREPGGAGEEEQADRVLHPRNLFNNRRGYPAEVDGGKGSSSAPLPSRQGVGAAA